MPTVKLFPISVVIAPPSTMSFPNMKSAPPATAEASPSGNIEASGAPITAANDIDDGFTPEERKKA